MGPGDVCVTAATDGVVVAHFRVGLGTPPEGVFPFYPQGPETHAGPTERSLGGCKGGWEGEGHRDTV